MPGTVRRRLREDAGFTLVELLTTMAVLMIVLVATLRTFDAFSAGSDANSRLTQGEDAARRQVDAMTRSLRNATPVGGQLTAIVRPAAAGAANELIFGSYGTADTGAARFGRYCVDTATRSLWFEESPGAVYSDPGSACPASGPWARTQVLAGNVANTAAQPLFSVDVAGRAVGIDLRIDGARTPGRRTIGLRTAAYLRSAGGRPPNLSVNDITVTCSTVSGHEQALLRLGAGIGGGDPLTASFALADIPIGTGAVKVAADSPVQVAVTVTNLLGLKQLLVKTVSC